LTTNFQTSVFQDSENNIWFTNEQTGLCKLTNQQLAFYPEIKPGFATSQYCFGYLNKKMPFITGMALKISQNFYSG